jgi:hypothetical protein
VTAFGVALANGDLLAPVGFHQGVIPVFFREQGSGFFIYVEFKIGASGRQIGVSTFNSVPDDPTALPDFQIIGDRPIGNGSAAVCDDGPLPFLGGVPAVVPPAFGGSQEVADAINDFSCRFDVRTMAGTGPCTRNALGVFSFVGADSTVQFCTRSGVGAELTFPQIDTFLTVRGRDVLGAAGPSDTIIIRVDTP